MKNIQLLLREVEYAYEKVPFYRKMLDKMGLSPATLTADNALSKLPFTEKVDYRKNFPMGVLAQGFSLNHPMLTSSRSSGTTGERLITIEVGMYLLQRAVSCAAISPAIDQVFNQAGRKIARYAAPNCSDVECANPNSQISDRLLSDNTLVLPVYHDLLTTTAVLIDRAIAEIESFAPDMFYVDPTHFAFLLREYKKRGLTPPDIPCMVSYTGATRVAKRQIEAFYPQQTHFSELLSSTEFGWIAMQCPQGHMHLNEDSYFFEFLAMDIEPLMGRPLYELCITSIDKGAVPHLRYRTGDIVSQNTEQCSCASSHRHVVLEGKLSHFIIYEGRPVMSPQQVDALLGAPVWLDQYQLEQSSDNSFMFKIMVNEHYENGNEDVFIEALQQMLKRTINVDTSVVDYISTERTGKFQSVRGLEQSV